MPVSAFDGALHALELQPDILLQVERIQVIQGLGPIPTAKYVHQTLVDDGGVPESDVGLAHERNVVEHRSW